MANMNLLESYKGRLAVSEGYYAKAHNGAKLSNNKKLVVAKLLENTNRFLNEAFENSVGTQRSDMGLYRKFALNLTTVSVPNLIAFDLVIVHPMSSMAGYVNYIEYVAGSNKGDMKQGEMLNSPFGLGKVDANYTSDRVVETLGADFKLMWTPVAKVVRATGTDGSDIDVSEWTVAADGTITGTDVAEGVKVAYIYDNVVIPQNDLPIISAEMKSIPLIAKARRIAIYYSQMAA